MAFFEPGNFTAGALIGTVLGAFIGHSLAIRRSNIIRFQNAADKFKAAFFEELNILEKPGPLAIDPVDLLQSAFNKHHLAYIEFRDFPNEITAFNNAWMNYYTLDDKNEEWLTKYSDRLNKEFGKTGRERAIENIHKLLAFTRK